MPRAPIQSQITNDRKTRGSNRSYSRIRSSRGKGATLAARIDSNRREPLRHHASGKSRVDQNARVPGLNENSVPVAAAAEHAKLHSADSLTR